MCIHHCDHYFFSQLTNHVISDLSCSADEVAKLLQSIDVNKASGPVNQHGFRPSRSCVTQLLQLVHEWFQALDKLGSVDAVFLDFAKAFDKVSHARLLYKLEWYGIKGQILNWLRDFLR